LSGYQPDGSRRVGHTGQRVGCPAISRRQVAAAHGQVGRATHFNRMVPVPRLQLVRMTSADVFKEEKTEIPDWQMGTRCPADGRPFAPRTD